MLHNQSRSGGDQVMPTLASPAAFVRQPVLPTNRVEAFEEAQRDPIVAPRPSFGSDGEMINRILDAVLEQQRGAITSFVARTVFFYNPFPFTQGSVRGITLRRGGVLPFLRHPTQG